MSQIQLTLTRLVKSSEKQAVVSGSSFVFQLILEMVGHQLDKAKPLQAAEFSASKKAILYSDEIMSTIVFSSVSSHLFNASKW